MKNTTKRTNAKMFTAIDLFAGAGGLTVGLKKAGFRVVAAVEIDEEIAATYRKNHPEVKLIVKDIREVTGNEILRLAGLKRIDLVAGCPPCQGFSKLTDKHHRNDHRNQLVLEMARLIKELNPRAFMMENVAGLAKRGLPLLARFERRTRSLGYRINRNVLQMADYGVPQSRRRLVALAGKGFEIALPTPTHARSPLEDDSAMKPWVKLGDVLERRRKPVVLSVAHKRGGPQAFNWHVVADLQSINLRRLRAIKAGASRLTLPKNLRPDCHKNSRGFENVYARMSWDDVAPTMTSRCTTLSSGRFGHPREDRTISVREAALIQTFPKRYKFETDKMMKACELVGNALPCRFAEIASERCAEALSEH